MAFPWVVLLLAATLAAAASGPDAAGEPRRPDILLVSIDSLRPDHLGCYGYARPTSPTIDRLAAGGTRFENAISTTSWTLPAHAAMFTGLYDATHGAVDSHLRLGEEHLTLAEVLSARGYRTGGFFGGPFLHPTYGLDQGFDHYQSCMTALPDDAPDAAVREEARAVRGKAHQDVTGPRTLAEVDRWLRTIDETPFFLFVHLWDVHYDYIPPQQYVSAFDPGYDGTLTGVDIMRNRAVRPDMAERDRRHLVALYDAEIRATDDTLERLLEMLQRRGRLEDTLVIVTADHGEEFFEHGGKGHVRTLFDEVIRVPLLMHWKGQIPAGRVIREQVRLIDLMPTILTLADVPSHALVQGRDLSPLMEGRPLPPEAALSELLVDGQTMRSLRETGFKLIDSGRGVSAGFDLLRDPLERHPVPLDGAATPITRSDLARVLAASRELRRIVAGGDRPAKVDPETMQRLRSLGYVGSH